MLNKLHVFDNLLNMWGYLHSTILLLNLPDNPEFQLYLLHR